MAYEINYNDEQFQKVETDRNQALAENKALYEGMINDTDQYYGAMIDASKQWADTQQQLQQEKTDFAIEQIEQQKEQTTKDYMKEQSGAYVDWQKQSNQYGANAEMMASQGLSNSGYSESSQVSMFNTYQNRLATARESYNTAILNYNNAIKDARLQNNSIMAEIAYTALQQQLELSLESFQYKNSLLLGMADSKNAIETRFDSKYQAVLDQMNKSNALQEELRQFNSSYSLDQQKLREDIRQFDASLAEEKRQFDATQASKASVSSGSSVNKTSSKTSSSSNGKTASNTTTIKDNATPTSKSGQFTTYKDAAQYLQKIGATKGDGGLMTESEWTRRKRGGGTGAEVKYDTYAEYLTNFVAWKKNNPDK